MLFARSNSHGWYGAGGPPRVGSAANPYPRSVTYPRSDASSAPSARFPVGCYVIYSPAGMPMPGVVRFSGTLGSMPRMVGLELMFATNDGCHDGYSDKVPPLLTRSKYLAKMKAYSLANAR